MSAEARELISRHWLYRKDAEVGRFPDLIPGIAAYLTWLATLPVKDPI